MRQRMHSFILKLQVFAKLRLTQVEWHGSEKTFFFKRIGIGDGMHRVLNGSAVQSLVEHAKSCTRHIVRWSKTSVACKIEFTHT